jgi:hypothetical protein
MEGDKLMSSLALPRSSLQIAAKKGQCSLLEGRKKSQIVWFLDFSLEGMMAVKAFRVSVKTEAGLVALRLS